MAAERPPIDTAAWTAMTGQWPFMTVMPLRAGECPEPSSQESEGHGDW